MRLLLSWIDQFRRITVENLPSVAAAIVSQFEEIVGAANTWGASDHNQDGTHAAVHFKTQTTTPAATVGAITLYWDGTNLKYLKPDGTTGNVV